MLTSMDLSVIILVVIVLVGLSGLRVANQYQRAVSKPPFRPLSANEPAVSW